ncbi:MAG: glycosyltransferase family 4 protein [Bacteroidaceae bacterium]|nr:glycosyltransferase family 4 protein [Bacteroidaceae bacterium]
MKTIVISAVNIRQGGTLTILRNCLEYLSGVVANGEYRVVALVHNKDLVCYPGIEYIEMPDCIKGWGRRLWCEYVTMRAVSKKLAPVYLWLSLHDTTPRVNAVRQAVYCQTSFPFLKLRPRDLLFNYKIVLFGLFTRFAYRIGIKKNKYLVVQANWLRDGFAKMFGLPRSRFIVAPPERKAAEPGLLYDGKSDVYTFFMASIADCHKNFETLCEAARLLQDEVGTGKFRVVLTIGADDNRYSKWLHSQWGTVESVEFAGYMDKKRLYDNYSTADCLVFASRVETWGLPISEFAVTGKPMLLADLPYAYETAAGAHRVAFFDACNAVELKDLMKHAMEGDCSMFASVPHVTPEAPVANTWQELFDILLG